MGIENIDAAKPESNIPETRPVRETKKRRILIDIPIKQGKKGKK